MLVGDMNKLKANLAKGVLEIQLALVQLYTNNLNAIGTQAALLAGFAFTGITSAPYPQEGKKEFVLEFFYFGCTTMAFGSALFCLCQTTVVSTYGAAMALSGDSLTSVKYAVSHMKLQQDFVFIIGMICITSILIAAISLSWARLRTGLAILNTLVYLGALVLILVKGIQVYMSVNNFGSFETSDSEMINKETNNEAYSSVKTSEKSDIGSFRESETIVSNSDVSTQSHQVTGQLWFRESIDLGGQLHERFGVLQKGVLEIYRNQRDFEKGKAPINEIPFQLRKYALEEDTKKFKRGFTSGKKSFRRLVSGQGEISLPVFVASEFDLKTAVKRFQFILYPKVVSEVRPLPVGEFMANDEQSYKHWIRAIQSVIGTSHQKDAFKRAMSANADIELVEHAVAKSNL